MINLSELTTFVFVRNDLGERQTEIQSNHACNRLGWRLGAEFGGNPPDSYLIAKAELNTRSLVKLAKKAADAGVRHYLMVDSDVDALNPTALAVFPLDDEQKELFRKYPLRTYSPRVEKSVAGFNAERGANAALAQSAHPQQGEKSTPFLTERPGDASSQAAPVPTSEGSTCP